MDTLKEQQAENYLKEAGLSLDAAKAIFEKAKEEDKNLWANVVKCCYDAVEQAVSAVLAKKGEIIPKEHPEKIKKLINLYSIEKTIERQLFYWLRRRSSSQYVDIKDGLLCVPHELFSEEDAGNCLEDSEEIIEYIRQMIE
ncbi:MAG TPA: HEPN domain-containing protein [Nanoarchaeota archaeon]|nr:HEPN domain-containing protein [Nanoarchaeota archaeon]